MPVAKSLTRAFALILELTTLVDAASRHRRPTNIRQASPARRRRNQA
jgi:hypothetical protein